MGNSDMKLAVTLSVVPGFAPNLLIYLEQTRVVLQLRGRIRGVEHHRRAHAAHRSMVTFAGRTSCPAYFGTNSFGFSDPLPNRNFSISATRKARALGSI